MEDGQGLQWGQTLTSWVGRSFPHLTRSIVRSPCLLQPTSQEYDTGSQMVSGSEGGCVEPSIQHVPAYVL